MSLIFGVPYITRHQEDITSSVSFATPAQLCTVDPASTPWGKDGGMYKNDKYARDRVMKSARLLLPYLKDNDLILDVGCFTQEARKYYPPWIKYLGIDQAQYHKDTKVLDLNHGFEPISSQHVLCLETLEHLLDPRDCLESISNSISENGYVVVSLPNEATLFHRIRGLLGIIDGECFSGKGKHLHLPSLSQSKALVSELFQIEKLETYISPSACGSRQPFVGKILSLIPDRVHEALARWKPSLFARGFIFLLKKRTLGPTYPVA